MTTKQRLSIVGLAICLCLVAGLFSAYFMTKDTEVVKPEVIVAKEEQTPAPVPKPLPFKCGNPKDIVIGTKIRDTCDDCLIPPGALGTVIGGMEECTGGSHGFIVLYDNYRSSDPNGAWCVPWSNLTILSQPTCEN